MEHVAREYYERGMREAQHRYYTELAPRIERVEVKQVHLPVYLESDKRQEMIAENKCMKERIEFYRKQHEADAANKAALEYAKKSATDRATRAEESLAAKQGENKRLARAIRIVGRLWASSRASLNERAKVRNISDSSGRFALLEVR
jgi:hypothetical protein